MIFNVSPAQWIEESKEPKVQALIFGEKGDYSDLPQILAEQGVSSLRTTGQCALELSSVRAVFGNFDPYSVSVAIKAGALYFGIPNKQKNLDFAQRCIAQKIGFYMPDNDSVSDLVLGGKGNSFKKNDFIDIQASLSYLVR